MYMFTLHTLGGCSLKYRIPYIVYLYYQLGNTHVLHMKYTIRYSTLEHFCFRFDALRMLEPGPFIIPSSVTVLTFHRATAPAKNLCNPIWCVFRGTVGLGIKLSVLPIDIQEELWKNIGRFWFFLFFYFCFNLISFSALSFHA